MCLRATDARLFDGTRFDLEFVAVMGAHAGLERRIAGALDATPSRIPVIPGGCGTGRTSLLLRLRDRSARGAVQYVDVDRCATTPERFLDAVISSSPFFWQGHQAPATAREAFDILRRFFDTARAPGGGPCTFLLDEVLELRTFESFPGLRRVLQDLFDGLAASPNRFVLTTRFVARAHRLLRNATARFEVMHVPALTVPELAEILSPPPTGQSVSTDDRDFAARTVQALTGGRVAYASAIAEAARRMGRDADPISTLAALLSVGGELDRRCRFSYELRLHRARGYGALKAILDILADEESITLTEIALRLRRTPGSTKDYLSWLEDVDLVTARAKRYSYTDPMLRLWVRLHCRPSPPTEEEVAREVQRYAMARLPLADGGAVPAAVPALAYAAAGAAPGDRKEWGIIEID